MPCFLSILQSPIQAFLRPAVWIPGLNKLHSHREEWVSLSGTANQLTDELVQAVDRVAESDPHTTYQVKKVDKEKHEVQIYNWTRAEWLDVVEIEFRDSANGGVEAKCFSFSSGFLPTWFPLCFVFNVIFFFIPFYDNKFNSTRLEALRVSMETECRLVAKSSGAPDETTPIVSKARHADYSSSNEKNPIIPESGYQETTPPGSEAKVASTEVKTEGPPTKDESHVHTPPVVDSEEKSPDKSTDPLVV